MGRINLKNIKVLALVLLIITFLSLQLVSVFAEGSLSLYPRGSLPGSARPYRPYTEWYAGTYVGMERHQIIKVYAKAGETIFFGSSTHSSRYEVTNGTRDIKVSNPDGSTSYFNVVNNGAGHINSLARETAGPRYTDNGRTVNAGGYTPLSIVASSSGTYIFEFYSPYNTPAGNPTARLTTELWNESNGGTIGAWDITVVTGLGSGQAQEIMGRTFCDYLCLNMGANFYSSTADWGKGLYATVYVLTDDGYIYRTDFNGMDPYGFLFFANNRGLVDPVKNTSLYHSARGSSNALDNLKVTLEGQGGSTDIYPTFHLPSYPDTANDRTHKIFFEEPSDDLPESIRAIPFAPGTVTDFKFFGEDDNIGYVGAGGLFTFYVTSGSSYQIKIDFAENYGDTGRAANTLYLSNSCQPGFNSIYWDGCDGNGDIVPKGIYGRGESDGTITITVEVKAGEYHFPLLDVESNPFGVKIELINTPFNADGSLYQWESPAAEKKARSTIYYDNSLIIEPGNEADNTTVGGVRRGALWQEINQQLCALEGISSENGASKYMASASNNVERQGGDFAFIDLWTYTVGDATSIESVIEEFELINPEESEAAQLRGFVFFDHNDNGNYSIQEGDYALKGIRVEIYDSENNLVANVLTDDNGWYFIPGLVRDETYLVRIYAPYKFAKFTTHSSGVITVGNDKYLTFSTGQLAPALNTADNVGIYYNRYNQTVQVTKKWEQSLLEDPARPKDIWVTAVGSHGGEDYLAVAAILNNNNGWNHIFHDLPAVNEEGDPLVYRVIETGAEGYFTEVDYQITEGGTVALYTLTNTPREMIIYKTLDKAVSTPQHFLFLVEGNTDGEPGNDISFQILLTVVPGATSASKILTHIPAGEYTVTELGTNWRYLLDNTATRGEKNGTIVAHPLADSLTLIISEIASYRFIFANQLENSAWLDFSTRVTNTMKAIN